ncbi:MAG: nucleoside deaminase [Desulfonatronovibrio sp.]
MTDIEKANMLEAINLSGTNIHKAHGGPFGAVVVKDGKIVGKGYNQVILTNDPTAHAEILAIRDACGKLGTYQLSNCEIYSSCEPCPMCLSAIYWARIDRLFFGCTRNDAQEIGFDDNLFYDEIKLPAEKRSVQTKQIMRNESIKVFNRWKQLHIDPAY